MAAIEDLTPEIMAEVYGCPEWEAERAMRDSIREFCTETLAWREGIDQFTAVADQTAYELDYHFVNTVPDSEVVAITEVTLDDRPASFAWDRKILSIHPDQEKVAAVTAALRPTRKANSVPDHIVDPRFEGIAAGAKYRLMRMPRTAWFNPELATVYRRDFESAVAAEKTASARGHSTQPTTIKTQRFI